MYLDRILGQGWASFTFAHDDELLADTPYPDMPTSHTAAYLTILMVLTAAIVSLNIQIVRDG